MKEHFAIYETALFLKNEGFNKPCFGGYFQQDSNIPFLAYGPEFDEAMNAGDDIKFQCFAPTYQQVLEWLRDEHWIDIVVIPRIGQAGRNRSYTCTICQDKNVGKGVVHELLRDEKGKLLHWINSRNAVDKGIEEALKIIKK